MKKTGFFLLAALWLAACGRFDNIGLRPDALSPQEAAAKMTAEAAAVRGSYAALQEACRIFGGLYARPALRERIAPDYFRAAFLLALRGRELGIGGDATLPLVGRLIAENPALARFKIWPEAAGFYEKMIVVMDQNQEALKAKIEEIKEADLVASRRAKMLAPKEAQLRTSETVEAASCFNAAVAWANAGKSEAARMLAGRAAKHPQFAERSAELLEMIK